MATAPVDCVLSGCKLHHHLIINLALRHSRQHIIWTAAYRHLDAHILPYVHSLWYIDRPGSASCMVSSRNH